MAAAVYIGQEYADVLLQQQRAEFNDLEMGLFKNVMFPADPGDVSLYIEPTSSHYDRQEIDASGPISGPPGNRFIDAVPLSFRSIPPTGDEIIVGFFLYNSTFDRVFVAIIPTNSPQVVFGTTTPLVVAVRFFNTYAAL